jgi:serine/threonine protein kinase
MLEGTLWANQEGVLWKSRIFIDTCSLVFIEEHKLECFWDNMRRLIIDGQRKPVIIAYGVYDELMKKSKNKSDHRLAINAMAALNRLLLLKNEHVIEIRGEITETFADNVLLFVFTKFRIKENLLLITQDNKLTMDMLSLNNGKAVNSWKRIYVRRIEKSGKLGQFYFDDSINPQVKKRSNISSNGCVEINHDEKLPLVAVPVMGDSLYTEDGNIIQLGNKIAAGGEGSVYEIEGFIQVAKLYDIHHLTRLRLEKITYMVHHKLEYPGICWPMHLLYNKQKEFVGYMMERAQGEKMQTSVFIKKIFEKKFPQWTKRDTIKLCLVILDKIKYLHDHSVILGDINPTNILIKNPEEVYFVDTDSYQFGKYLCPVGTVIFTAPEIQERDYSTFYRTLGHENFAIATLLFMIMLPGKSPYAQQGGDSAAENIRKMDFPYPYEENSSRKTPEGQWRFVWSQLPKKMKEAFYKTFQKGEDYSSESTRLGVDDWIKLFGMYQYSLENYMIENDPQALMIFPNRLKRYQKENEAIGDKNIEISSIKNKFDQNIDNENDRNVSAGKEENSQKMIGGILVAKLFGILVGITSSIFVYDMIHKLEAIYDKVSFILMMMSLSIVTWAFAIIMTYILIYKYKVEDVNFINYYNKSRGVGVLIFVAGIIFVINRYFYINFIGDIIFCLLAAWIFKLKKNICYIIGACTTLSFSLVYIILVMKSLLLYVIN